MRHFRTILLLAAAVILAGCTSASSKNARISSLASQDEALTVLSFNIRQWTRDTDSDSPVFWKKRMAAMERMIRDLDPDVICFQEFMAPVGLYVPSGYRRVGITASHPIYVRRGLRTSGHEVAVHWDRCTVEGINLINVHTRWESDILAKTVEQVNERLTGTDLACGDWNNSLAPIIDKGLRMESVRQQLGVPETDTFANFTRPTESHGAIDHFFVTPGVKALSYRMVTDGYGCEKMSDHFPILLRVMRIQ